MGHHANRSYDMGYLSRADDRGNQIAACKPEWSVGSEIVVANVLRHPVVNRPNGQDVVIGLHESKELEAFPLGRIKALFEGDAAEEATDVLGVVLKRSRLLR